MFCEEIDLSARFNINDDFVVPTPFELGKIPDFMLHRSFKRAVPHRNDVITETIIYFESEAKIPSYADPSFSNFENGEK